MRTTDGLELKVRRIKAGLYQYELAARVGISQTRLSEIECGRLHPSPELAEQILEAIRKARSAKRQ